MPDSTRYTLNVPGSAAQVADGELLIINFDSGRYYAVNESATALWALIVDHHLTLEEASDLVSASAETKLAFRKVVQLWLDESILIPLQSANEASFPSSFELPPGVPIVEIFSDLEDLLLLDPIHDVDEAGWPIATKAS